MPTVFPCLKKLNFILGDHHMPTVFYGSIEDDPKPFGKVFFDHPQNSRLNSVSSFQLSPVG